MLPFMQQAPALSNSFLNLLIALGGTINFNGGDVVVTHSADQLTVTGGHLAIGTGLRFTIGSSTIQAAALGVVHDGNAEVGARWVDTYASAATNNAISFIRNGSAVGSITESLTNTAYNTSSDRDRKCDQRPYERSGEIIDALVIYDFAWKAYPELRGVGVFAQEAYEVFPDAIVPSKEKGGWQADYSKFVPVLLAELKHLRARVADLEARSAA